MLCFIFIKLIEFHNLCDLKKNDVGNSKIVAYLEKYGFFKYVYFFENYTTQNWPENF